MGFINLILELKFKQIDVKINIRFLSYIEYGNNKKESKGVWGPAEASRLKCMLDKKNYD